MTLLIEYFVQAEAGSGCGDDAVGALLGFENFHVMLTAAWEDEVEDIAEQFIELCSKLAFGPS